MSQAKFHVFASASVEVGASMSDEWDHQSDEVEDARFLQKPFEEDRLLREVRFPLDRDRGAAPRPH